MPIHRDLLPTTAVLRIPIRRALTVALVDLEDVHLTTVLKALLYQITPSVRFGTLGWVCEVVVVEAEAARQSGKNDLADKLYYAANEVFAVLQVLSESNT
jgi:hypothetical protein